MRPVTRPAISVGYLAVQNGIQTDADAAQTTYRDLADHEWQAAYWKKVVAAIPVAGATAATKAAIKDALEDVEAADTDEMAQSLFGIAAPIPLAPVPGGIPAIGPLTAQERADARRGAAVWLAVFQEYRLAARVHLAIFTEAVRPEYQQARPDLIAGIGQYCSYCEMPMTSGLAVEHTAPKASFPGYAATWTNFLLACAACNSAKGQRPSYTDVSPGLTLTPALARAAAVATLRTPADPDYAEFRPEYSYVMWRVVRVAGRLVSEDPITDLVLYGLVSANEITFGPSGSGVILARTSRLRSNQFAASVLPVTAYANGSWNNGIPLFTDYTGVPASLSRANLDLREYGTWGVVTAPATTGAVTSFELEHRVTYAFDLAPGTTTISHSSGMSMEYDSPAAVMRQNITNGVLTQDLAGRLRHQSWPRVVATPSAHSTGSPPRLYDVTVTDRYLVRATAGVDGGIQIRLISELPIELRITTNTPVGLGGMVPQARRQRTIQLLDLNNDVWERAGGPPPTAAEKRKRERIVDRRVYRRTLAWCTAVNSVRRAIRAAELAAADPTLGPQYSMVIRAIGETAKATGCWTLWWDVVNRMAPRETQARVRVDLRERLEEDYPGTRLPAPDPPLPAPPPGV